MKYRALKQHFTQSLTMLYDEQESTILFFIALEKAGGLTKMQFLEQQQEAVDLNVENRMLSVLNELQSGKPLQYIFEECFFYNLCFKVNPSVLIPRDETEELVDLIIKTAGHQSDSAKRILDIGTGSGCIAITLKKNLPASQVSAMDVSSEALCVAKENAQENHVDVDFILADIMTYSTDDKYDIIVSNPPYVKDDERIDMHQNVLAYEPHIALFVRNDDPLIFYRTIAEFACISLNPGGQLYFEINEYLGGQMVTLMASLGFKDIRLIKDLQGKDRIIACIR